MKAARIKQSGTGAFFRRCPLYIFIPVLMVLNVYSQKGLLPGKLFVHSDKSFYTAGEIIWFKIYGVDAVYNRPLPTDKVAYIEILDQHNVPILQARVGMQNGKGDGSFFIPYTVNTGRYTLRAYTRWMMNFDPGSYFEKGISFFNPRKVIRSDKAKEPEVYAAGLFPEGGNLVEGLRSRIGYKVTDRLGKGVDCTGYLLQDAKDTILRFRSLRYGMGDFYYTPVGGRKVEACFNLTDTVICGPMPVASAEGFVMHVADTGKGLVEIRVRANTSFPLPVYLRAGRPGQSPAGAEGEILSEAILMKGEAHFLIERSKLAEGFSAITIFNSAREPVCERLYFKKPASLRLRITPGSDSSALPGLFSPGTREKLAFDLRAWDQNGNPSTADMSAAVYQVDELQGTEEPNILNYLWLSSGLRGIVESPDAYFQDGADTSGEMQNLLLTQGWRRFDPPVSIVFAPEYEGAIIKGRVLDRITGHPAQGVSAFISIPGKRSELGHSMSDAQGELQFVFRDLYGADQLVVQTAEKKDSLFRVEIASPFSDRFSNRAIPAFKFSFHLRDIYLSRAIASQVQNIYELDNLQRLLPFEVRDSTAFYRSPSKKYFLDQYTRFNSMEEVFREYVQDMILRRSAGKYYVRVFDEPHKTFFGDDPLVLVDGVPVHDFDSLMAFDPLKFFKIEVKAAKYRMGSKEINGIISLSTYAGDLAGYPLDANALVLEYNGLQQKREFYMPAYSEGRGSERLPDLRNVLYWSPTVATDEQGRGRIRFTTSDLKGRYALVVQGISREGLAGSQVFTFEVH